MITGFGRSKTARVTGRLMPFFYPHCFETGANLSVIGKEVHVQVGLRK